MKMGSSSWWLMLVRLIRWIMLAWVKLSYIPFPSDFALFTGEM
jgi:hypothetical protein